MRLLIPIIAFALLLACGQAPVRPQGSTTPTPAPEAGSSFMLSSPAFANNEAIPDRYSSKDTNYSPPLNWYDAPRRTKTFVLMVEDPDAPRGTFTHWVAYNIPDTARRFDENVPKQEMLPNGMRQLNNDAGRIGYYGPMPPPGKVHHYIFTLYAIDQELNPVGDKTFLLNAMQGHIIGQAQLTGTYQR
jgi:Raf kinase inhibitor-like YbhB/YbcL family protein